MVSRVEKNKKTRKKIENIEKSERTKSFLKAFIKTVLITGIIVFSIFISIRYIANLGIIVREYPVKYSNIPKSFHGFKIVHFGDFYNNPYSNNLDYYIDKINELKPDLVLFTGGLKHKDYDIDLEEQERLIKKFSKIKSTVGNYYILGEYDNETVSKILSSSNFKDITDTTEEIYFEGEIPIILSGIKQNINIDYGKNKNLFIINMVYKPDLADEILNYNSPNLILAGSSVNGQFRLPYIGGLIKQDGYKKYYDKEYQINDTKLYITGGLGTNNVPARLFNHPSINFYRLMHI